MGGICLTTLKMKEIKINSLSDLSGAAAEFIAEMVNGKVYAFYGDMGVGKTTFISEVCKLLGVEDDTSSPTFSIINEYETVAGERLYHFDCYRLESPEEAFDVGAEDYFDSGCTCFVEWPENIEPLLPDDVVRVLIQTDSRGIRTLRLP